MRPKLKKVGLVLGSGAARSAMPEIKRAIKAL